ncbi:helix-turn-helix transcriptional regulator [Sphaerochaeta pleomorpha]|uniref:helix-turn-helix transcriptional regulator n=1 Tax=Sphaerochaeta pleomorpha TaxID=1131707 RepID=UPI00155B3106|nr:helix-turn-helix transcriptional regulator [Sphaerochaeta pleomorpha]
MDEKMNLESIAKEVSYSKFHIHRVFSETVGMPLFTYLKRRQLTEAASMLTQSEIPILDIALMIGYESQQAFSTMFKALYKKTPNTFRQDQQFYPLQLPYSLHAFSKNTFSGINWVQEITSATMQEMSCWRSFLPLIIDGFPYLEEENCLFELKKAIDNDQLFSIQEEDVIIGAIILDPETGKIPFLGIHPQFKQKGVYKAFFIWAAQESPRAEKLSLTTYRDRDKADTGYRTMLKNLGFKESRFLVEYGYPTQSFEIPKIQLLGQ